MEFKQAYELVEKKLAAKLLKTCPSQEVEDQNAFVFNLYSDTFEKVRTIIGVELDLVEMTMFLGKMMALGGVDFLKPGFGPEELRTALRETAQMYEASFVDIAHAMYGQREQHLIQKKAQGQGQAQGQAQVPNQNRVVDLSEIRK